MNQDERIHSQKQRIGELLILGAADKKEIWDLNVKVERLTEALEEIGRLCAEL